MKVQITWRDPLIDLVRLVEPFDYESVLAFVNLVDADHVYGSGAVAHDERHVQRPYRAAAKQPCGTVFLKTTDAENRSMQTSDKPRAVSSFARSEVSRDPRKPLSSTFN